MSPHLIRVTVLEKEPGQVGAAARRAPRPGGRPRALRLARRGRRHGFRWPCSAESRTKGAESGEGQGFSGHTSEGAAPRPACA